MGLLPTVLTYGSVGFSRAKPQEMQSGGTHGDRTPAGSVGAQHGGDVLGQACGGEEQWGAAMRARGSVWDSLPWGTARFHTEVT